MTRTRLLAALALLAGCYSPTVQPGKSCSVDGKCPEGQMCFPDNRCYPAGFNPDCDPACSGAKPVCDKTTLMCVGCLMDKDCPAGFVCAAQTCKPGCNAGHTQCEPDAGSCDVDAGICRGCLDDAECPGGRCDVASGLCVECLPQNDNCPDGKWCDVTTCKSGCKTAASCPTDDAGGSIDCCAHACVDIQSAQENCGGCGTTCKQGNTCCAGMCTDVQADVANCGACGTPCALAHVMGPVCTAGVCDYASCEPGYGDCDGNRANGCEIQIDVDVANCGMCGMACGSVANGVADCKSGACIVGRCNAPFDDCDTMFANGCETNLNTSAAHCAMCGKACMLANATPRCTSGACQIQSCNAGFANCDMMHDNGCEQNVFTDPANCGTCGMKCSVANGTPGCTMGACRIASCGSTFRDCKNGYADGCETNVNTDVNNCGGCNTACNLPNATASCVNGTCAVATCNAGFGNCDNIAANGCETNLNTTLNHCGMCGKQCMFANAAAGCTNGTCTLGACNANFGNCDNNAANGCEQTLLTDVNHCGMCGKQCGAVANGTAKCAAGVCAVNTCTAKYGDCDGNFANGCEANLVIDANNCNTCGNRCAVGTPICSNSSCQSLACTNGRLVPGSCTAGTDPETGAAYTVCSADCNTIFISAANGNGGEYHAQQICQLYGYRTLSQMGGTCGNVCGYCMSYTCASPQATPNFDGGGTSCGVDTFGQKLCFTVMWRCTR